MSRMDQHGAIRYHKYTGLELYMDLVDDSGAAIPMPLGSVALMHVRDSVDGPLLAELSTENGAIALHATNGRITIQGEPELFTDLEANQIYQYDLVLTILNGLPRRIVGGDFIVESTITHA